MIAWEVVSWTRCEGQNTNVWCGNTREWPFRTYATSVKSFENTIRLERALLP